MKRLLQWHWFWFAVAFVAVSVLDYIDHVTRPGQSFAEQPLAWGMFTVASTAGVLGGIAATRWLLGRVRKIPGVLLDAVSLFPAFALHVWVTGPLANRCFWPESVLSFRWMWAPPAIGIALLLLCRAGTWVGRQISKPSSRSSSRSTLRASA